QKHDRHRTAGYINGNQLYFTGVVKRDCRLLRDSAAKFGFKKCRSFRKVFDVNLLPHIEAKKEK
ncbi:MAG: hypothetical protein ACRCWC_06385, partial [Plesiomonas shigelloides]